MDDQKVARLCNAVSLGTALLTRIYNLRTWHTGKRCPAYFNDKEFKKYNSQLASKWPENLPKEKVCIKDFVLTCADTRRRILHQDKRHHFERPPAMVQRFC
jgi:hypothetical protein